MLPLKVKDDGLGSSVELEESIEVIDLSKRPKKMVVFVMNGGGQWL